MKLAEPADAALLAAIHAASFAPLERWSDASFSELLGMNGTQALVSGEEGFVMLRLTGDEAEIITLAVRPDFRRAGLGRALMEAAMRVAAIQGGAVMFLEVAEGNEAARRLYASLGFEEVGRRKNYYPDGQAARVLRFPLVGEG
ncbi:ribosomal protein S18-alanine N-acetyltransferase [Acetobacteraceae bacterium H6797]|nr:ribosomal protein S18-alanine N-acetyltransferase [Acetobacteraceae bacterium H6797]